MCSSASPVPIATRIVGGDGEDGAAADSAAG